MSNPMVWAKGLGITVELLKSWQSSAGESDLLRWAIANGKLPELKYLNWAKNYYQLPCLEPSFFEQHTPNPELWKKWGEGSWSGSFLPIYEWDGVLYIACLEPPNAEQGKHLEGLPTRFSLLLAPLSGMKKWWHILYPVKPAAPALPPELAQFAVPPGERNLELEIEKTSTASNGASESQQIGRNTHAPMATPPSSIEMSPQTISQKSYLEVEKVATNPQTTKTSVDEFSPTLNLSTELKPLSMEHQNAISGEPVGQVSPEPYEEAQALKNSIEENEPESLGEATSVGVSVASLAGESNDASLKLNQEVHGKEALDEDVFPVLHEKTVVGEFSMPPVPQEEEVEALATKPTQATPIEETAVFQMGRSGEASPGYDFDSLAQSEEALLGSEGSKEVQEVASEELAPDGLSFDLGMEQASSPDDEVSKIFDSSSLDLSSDSDSEGAELAPDGLGDFSLGDSNSEEGSFDSFFVETDGTGILDKASLGIGVPSPEVSLSPPPPPPPSPQSVAMGPGAPNPISSPDLSERSVILHAPGVQDSAVHEGLVGESLDEHTRMLAISALKSFEKRFDKAMVLCLERAGLTASLWSEGWKYNKNNSKRVDLNHNSIFRIVNSSRKPYHGYVVKNPINDAFFYAFNEGVYPDHCTIVPVMINNNLVAMILGICSAEKSDLVDLSDCEEVADEMANDLTKLSQSLAA